MRNNAILAAVIISVAVRLAGDEPKTKGAVIVSSPACLAITAPEGVVEFQPLEIRSVDGRLFRITRVRAEKRLVNLNCPQGVKVKTQTVLAYLASTLKPGHYEDVIVFDLDEHDQSTLRVFVTINIKS